MSKLYEVLTTPHCELDTKWVDPSKKCMQFQMICRFWAINQFVLKQGVLFVYQYVLLFVISRNFTRKLQVL